MTSSLTSQPVVRSALARLHAEAGGDWWMSAGITPRYFAGPLRGRMMYAPIAPAVRRDIYMGV